MHEVHHQPSIKLTPESDPNPPVRGHRVRELVCAYRPLRDATGRMVDIATLALSTPRIPE
jgi:hypothetical protein